MRSENLNLSQLLLDPNNYRLQEQEGFVPCAQERYHLERVQSGTLQRLKQEALKPLRDSIVANGFLEIERIVVTPYNEAVDQFLVIEGNRRVAALRQLQDEYNAGVDIQDSLVRIFGSVPCLVAEGENLDPFFREAIMGIRHVGGIKEWGGFQRAKLIADLLDNHSLEASVISQKLGLSVVEVNRRYRAYKALQQMQEDDNYNEYASPKLYPLFHEAVSLPVVREWLGWNSEATLFEDNEKREIFYQLISPRESEDAEIKDPKLKTYLDVRQLREILPNSDARTDLLQMDRELIDALTIAKRNEMSRRWRREVSEATTALESIPALELDAFNSGDVDSIEKLIEIANRVLHLHRRAAE